MTFHVYHDRDDTPHCLLVICSTKESAQHWIDRFDPTIWMNKTMQKECLKVVEK